jgi:hypothetical protein
MRRRLLWVAFALSLAVEWLLPAADPSLAWWHRLPAFQGAYGLLGCLAIIVVSKALGKAWLQRPEADDE